MREFLSGNEAIARGAFEANVWVATGYPGTPSSEIIETISEKYSEINSEWSVNEKVALEVALGSSLGGARSIVTMKHVGLNVAADPFMTSAYTGINAGLLIVSADDPGMHSSQNEQDSRNYAKFAKIPLLEPGDSNEAKEFVKIGMGLSEKFDTPVLLRPVTRVSHTKSVVHCDKAVRKRPAFNYHKNPSKFVMVPANAIPRHRVLLDRYERISEFSNQFEYNTVEYHSLDIGIITHGLIYNYVREALPEASILKISLYPIPMAKIREFAARVKKLYIVEELDPIIEEEILAGGISAIGKKIIPMYGELFAGTIKKAFYPEEGEKNNKTEVNDNKVEQILELPPRPPVLCKGCGHIPVFETLRDLKYTVFGDIGCYTLGVLPPYGAMDTTICMGASIGNEIGFNKVGQLNKIKPDSVAVIGDSTFTHSGITNLLNAVYNKTPVTVLILDNHITAMTGHQPDVSSGLDNKFEKAGEIDLESLVKGLGVKRVKRVNAYKKNILRETILEEVKAMEPSVIIVDEFCVISESRIKRIINKS